jgi:serine/threonine protein kinase
VAAVTSPTSSPDEGPVLVGPYRLLGQLGGGGMGIVWQAEHAETGAVVALKTVRLPEPRMLASIRREIHALTRLRHAGVVRVVARGVEAGLPWYAMELLTGRTLADLVEGTWSDSQYGFTARTLSHSRRLPTPVGLAGAETEVGGGGLWATVSRVQHTIEMNDRGGREPEPRGPRDPTLRPPAAAGAAPTLLRVALRLCETLAVVHGAGVVHRDLKPENVFVRATGEPVLVDFGLAAHGAIGREMLDAGGAVVGTLHYMAPEQLQGEYVDARADLYSLGCILYECLTGEPPFIGTPMQVIHQHLTAPPDPLASRVDGVSPALEALVQRLLCKDPRERAGYAADVAAELAELVGEPATCAPASRQLYRAGFAGRDAELDGLGALLDHLSYGTGKLALVHGPIGAGKTRLLMEFARRAAATRPVVINRRVPGDRAAGRRPAGFWPRRSTRSASCSCTSSTARTSSGPRRRRGCSGPTCGSWRSSSRRCSGCRGPRRRRSCRGCRARRGASGSSTR